jgi:hypothetical protein
LYIEATKRLAIFMQVPTKFIMLRLQLDICQALKQGIPRNKPLAWQISSKCHIWWRCLHYFGNSITFVTYNTIQSWILFPKSDISKPPIFLEPYLRPILNRRRAQAKEILLCRHESSPEMRIARFPKKLR